MNRNVTTALAAGTITWTYLPIYYPGKGTVVTAHRASCRHAALGYEPTGVQYTPADIERALAALAETTKVHARLAGITGLTVEIEQARCLSGHDRECEPGAQFTAA